AQALTVAMFGGVGTVWGPIIGAAILIPLGEILHAELGATYPGIQGVILGAAIIAVILIAPEGVFWKTRDFLRRRGAVRARAALPEHARRTGHAAPKAESTARQETARRPRGGEVILDVAGLSRSFRGLKSVQSVSFEVRKGMILGIIGPNGAGKSSLFN